MTSLQLVFLIKWEHRGHTLLGYYVPLKQSLYKLELCIERSEGETEAGFSTRLRNLEKASCIHVEHSIFLLKAKPKNQSSLALFDSVKDYLIELEAILSALRIDGGNAAEPQKKCASTVDWSIN